MSNAPTPMSMSTIDVDGSASKIKRRLSDASEDSNAPSKSKKFIGADGKLVKDGSNKTKSGRFKPGAPVDLDEQCGVVTEKNVLCSRSLTCKTHGMGAKRSVPGRSKPFDNLLVEFQKKKEHRLKMKAERERAQEELLKKEGGSGTGTAVDASALTKVINVDADGEDIAVPQAGSSASHSIRLLSPSPLNSVNVPVPSSIDDIQVQQSHHDLLQPLSQSSRPPSGSGQHNNSGVPHQQQPPESNVQTLPSSTKVKASQLQQAASGANGSPAKPTTASGAASAPASTKKKKTGEGGKTSKNKTPARNKADLILGEVDDPPEPANAAAASSTLIGADGNFIVEEEAPDSDDEVDQLLIAMNQSRARPLALPTFPPYERTPMKLAKYRESFLTAFTGRSMSSSTS